MQTWEYKHIRLDYKGRGITQEINLLDTAYMIGRRGTTEAVPIAVGSCAKGFKQAVFPAPRHPSSADLP